MEPDKLCWWCEHFYYRQAQEDWSEFTPGYSFAIECGKDHWRFDSCRSTQAEFGACITAARTCKDFVPVEGLK